MSVNIAYFPIVNSPLSIKYLFHNDINSQIFHSYIDFKFGDYNSMINYLKSFNCENTFLLYSINDAAVVFNDSILNATNKFISTKIIKVFRHSKWDSPAFKSLNLKNMQAQLTMIYHQIITYFLNSEPNVSAAQNLII